MDECNLIHLQGEESALGLIDFSSENDSLVFNDDESSQHHNLPSENWNEPQNVDLFDSMNDDDEAITDESINQIEQLPDLSESSKPDRVRRKGSCNLRKSLAWDSAFFTSAGVLDPEELSGMIGGPERSRNQVLPRIIEDIGGSTDSISTLGSENLTADNFEAELFEDIRASVQISSEKIDAPGYQEVSKKSPTLPPGRKIDPATQNQVKLKTALKKPDVMSKAIPKQNLRIQRPVKTTKQISALSEVTKSVRIADSATETTKPPQIIGKGRSISTLSVKRDSLGAAQGNKNENDTFKTSTGASKGAQDIKVASSIGAHRTLPKPAPSSKSSSTVSLSRLKTESARSSTDSSGSYPSDTAAKYPITVSRRKVSDRQLKPPSGSTLKTPIKSAINNQTATRSYAPSAYLKSSKISSGVSPASSISEWSSASSMSSSIINGKFNKSRTSFDVSSCQSLDNESLALDLDHPSDDMLDGCEHRAIGSHSSRTKISSTRPVALAHSASAKPSGLRMPSPTIGFFDGVKSVCTPNGSAQPHHSDSPSLSKSGAVVCRPAKHMNTKAKVGKHLNTQKPPQVMAPEVITLGSDEGPTEAKDSSSSLVRPNQVINVPSDGNMDVLTGSKNDPNVIASNTNASKPEYKESLLMYRKEGIVAKDGENDLEEDVGSTRGKFDQKERGVLEEQQDEVN